MKKTKLVKCYYCQKEIEVYFKSPNFKSVCPKCQDEGKKSPIFTSKVMEKRRETCIRKYGVENTAQLKEVREKHKKTCLAKYGYENANHNEEIKKKIKETNLKKYGVESPLQSKEILAKVVQTNLKKYGVENPSQIDLVKEKKIQTCLKNYGVTNPSKCDEIQSKKIETSLERYGTSNPMKCEEIKKRLKSTFIEKYGVSNPMVLPEFKEKLSKAYQRSLGVDWPMQSEEVRQKSKQSCLEKYGVENPNQCKEVREKTNQTILEKYGYEKITQVPEIKKKSRETIRKNMKKKSTEFLQSLNIKLIGTYVDSMKMMEFKCEKCNTIFEDCYFNIRCYDHRCPICNPKQNGFSKPEEEISNFIESILPKELKVQRNSKNIIPPLELDIYIPDKNLAIEFDGLYWHSEEMGIDPSYHLNKTERCNQLNIQLIHVFEDEWILKKDIVKSRLKQILNVQDNIRIHARQCEIKEIDPRIKNIFLEEYHIQGKDNSTIKLGAFYKSELVSVMTFSKPNLSKGQKTKKDGVWELNRFCSNPKYHIPGIASKFLSYFKFRYEWKEIYSYADRRWSNGNLYYKLGFKLDHITQPNYWYLKGGYNRIHRFALRKKYDEPKDISEFELRSLEGYSRIWDCGNLKFSTVNREGKIEL